MVNIYLLPCHISQFLQSIEDVAPFGLELPFGRESFDLEALDRLKAERLRAERLLGFGQFEKLPLKYRVV